LYSRMSLAHKEPQKKTRNTQQAQGNGQGIILSRAKDRQTDTRMKPQKKR
jgi:hypothetical protein